MHFDSYRPDKEIQFVTFNSLAIRYSLTIKHLMPQSIVGLLGDLWVMNQGQINECKHQAHECVKADSTEKLMLLIAVIERIAGFISWQMRKSKVTFATKNLQHWKWTWHCYPQIRLIPTHPHITSADFIRILSVATTTDPHICLLPIAMQRISGLPVAKSKILGPNVYKISGHFCRFHEAQDTENARFSVLKCYSLKQFSIAVLKMLLRHCYI